MRDSIRRHGRLLLIIAALVLSVVAMSAPRVVGALLETALRSARADDGARSEVDRVTFAWPARLHVEGLRVRLAANDEPAVAVRSVDVRLAPLRWLRGEGFLHITLAEPRVVLRRRPDGTYDLIDRLRIEDAAERVAPDAQSSGRPQAGRDDATEPEPDPAAAAPDPDATDEAADDAGTPERPSMDASRWTRADDPLTFVHGTVIVSNGDLLIVDPAAGERTELYDLALEVRVRTDEVLTFHVSARQRGRAGREGAITMNGRVAFAAGIRFWSDPGEILRRVELDARMRLAPCTVGDVDIGGALQAALHGGHATLAAGGTLNGGRAFVHAEAQTVPPSHAPTGDLRLALRDVGLCPAFAPILAPLNPIFDVGDGTMAGRLDSMLVGSWAASPTGEQRSRLRGRVRVNELAVSGAPVATALLRVLGEPGGELRGDLRAPDVRSENGRISYDGMALTGRDRHLTFSGAIAADGVLRLCCDVRPRRLPTDAVGAPLRVPIVGWLDAPRVIAPDDRRRAASLTRAGGAGRTSSCESSGTLPR